MSARKLFKPLLLLALLAGPAISARSEDGGVAFKIEKPKPLVLATPFRLGLEVMLPSDDCKIFIDTTTQPSETFEITGIKNTDEGNGRSRRFEFTAIPFDIGIATFPALSWTLNCADSSTSAIKSPELPLEVASISTPTAGGGDIIEIRPQYAPGLKLPWWAWLLLGVLAAASLYYYLRRRQRLLNDPSLKPDTRPPHVRALDDLEALLLSQLWEEGNYMEFYVRLSGILRDYLERRFGLSADKLTTAELHRALMSGMLVDASVAGGIRVFLNSCDMVKFAKQVPTGQQKETEVEKFREIIEQTKPLPPAENTSDGKTSP